MIEEGCSVEWIAECGGMSAAARAISRSRNPLAGRRLLLGTLALLTTACASTGSPEEVAYVFYPNLPETPRIQYLTTFGSKLSARGKIGWLEEFLYGAAPTSQIQKPYGVDIHDGKLFVVDTIAAGVAVVDVVDGGFKLLGVKGTGRLQKPINIAVDEDGTRYVTDRKLGRVMIYDAENRYVTAFGDPEAWAPSDVAIAGDELYVADRRNGQVAVLDKDSGEELRRLGREGIGVAEFLFPTNLALDGEGNVYVSDTLNYRIQKVDPEGEPLQQFGEVGDALGQFARPKGIAVDREDRLYAVDAAFSNVQIFNAEGQLLLVLGGPGGDPGNMYLPAKVVIDYDNVDVFADRVAPGYELEYLILVTNQYGPNKINIYGFLKQGAGE
jgi:DNA-binding beta-propeller fold protein YncE